MTKQAPMQPVDLPHIRNITISGRIAAGSTTLAKHLAEKLQWRHIEGGEIFWETVRKKLGLQPKDTHLRPDASDQEFDRYLHDLLQTESHIVVETKLAGFNAQGIVGVFKILVICENEQGVDQAQIRIDRLINREGLTIEEAKEEILVREQNDREKWQRLYAKSDSSWTYLDPKYYDLIINTYSHNQEDSLTIALDALGIANAL